MMSHAEEIQGLIAVSDELQNNAAKLSYEATAPATYRTRSFDYVSEHRLNFLRSYGLAISTSASDYVSVVSYPSPTSLRNSDSTILSPLNVALRTSSMMIVMMLSLVFISIFYANISGNAVKVYGQNQLIDNRDGDFRENTRV